MRPALFVSLLLAACCLAGPVCPQCGHEAADGWKFCPVDGALLNQGCPHCKRPVQSDWLYCPYDASPLRADVPAPSLPAPVEPAAPVETAPGRMPGVEDLTGPAPLDNLAPDKAVELWFDLVGRGERDLIEQLMVPEFLEQLEGDEYFDRLLRASNRLMFRTGHLEILRFRIGENKAEFEVDLVRPDRPDEPLRYRFMLEQREGRWFVAGIS